MAEIHGRKKSVIYCKLLDGRIVRSDAVSKNNGVTPDWYNDLFEFIGVGTYHTINGIQQEGTGRFRFYRSKS